VPNLEAAISFLSVKSFLLMVLLALAGFTARAQTYYLDLSNQTLTLSDNALAVEKVVDGRAGQPPIGIVYRGLGGKSAAVGFRQGLETELTTFLQMQLPLRATSGHTIVLCLRSLHIGETMGGNKQQATADLSADVYEHLPTGYFFVRNVGSHASTYGYETTGRHAGHLAQLLSDCFRQLNTADWADAARQPVRTLAEQTFAHFRCPLFFGEGVRGQGKRIKIQGIFGGTHRTKRRGFVCGLGSCFRVAPAAD
jgi:hypothetical protein